MPNERRQIEKDLFSGRLKGVAATNALELGVDIGSLDVALLVHYPGTIASAWQQAGRSGRRQDESVAILLAGNDPVDQYLLRHPEYFFAQPPEHAVVDPENPYVLANHLKAAAYELPLAETDACQFGDLATSIAEVLCEAEQLSAIDGKFYFAGGQNPAHKISLRHMSDDTFSIVMVNSKRAAGVPDQLPRHPTPLTARPTKSAMPLGPARHELPDHYEVIANVDEISAPEVGLSRSGLPASWRDLLCSASWIWRAKSPTWNVGR